MPSIKFKSLSEALALNERITNDCLRAQVWSGGTDNYCIPAQGDDGYYEVPILPGYEQFFTFAEREIAATQEGAFQNKLKDVAFGERLLLEFLTGQAQVSLDNATYRLVSDLFKYAEAALKRGDLPQAKTELQAIAVMEPVWSQEAKDYFINKINQYLGV